MKPGNITYEVTAVVRAELCEEYETYMREHHIQDLMSTGAFLGASLSRSSPGRYRIRYEATDRQALDRYLRHEAPRLRRHAMDRFPEGVSLEREEWTVLAVWPMPGTEAS